MLAGGKTPESDANDEVQAVLEGVKDDLKQKLGHDLPELKAVKYSTQLVRGTNYFIKAHVGNGKYAHVRVHKDLPVHESKLTLHSVQADKSHTDPIEFF